MAASLPIIDIDALIQSDLSPPSPEAVEISHKIADACSSWGFFQITGHGISIDTQRDLLRYTSEFFAQPIEEKLTLDVRKGGVAWRGYMPLGGEGTHGRVDHKEGLYFGPEHPADHPNTGLPLHGKNQFPDGSIPAMRTTVLQYIDQVTELGKTLCDAISLSLGLDGHYVRDHYLKPEPVALFRAFKYASPTEDTLKRNEKEVWGIGEHTDFGLLTLLAQSAPGLQVFGPHKEWVDVPVLENGIVCNVGDMLDMLTGGRFKSVPHRVLPPPLGSSRISFPFFFDFSWNAKMIHLPLNHLTPPLSEAEKAAAKERWANTTFTSVNGEWWQYLAKKVMKVFPDLNLPDFESNSAPSTRFSIAVPT